MERRKNRLTPIKIISYLSEISVPEAEYELTHLRDGLNGKVWDKSGKIKSQVKDRLLDVAKLFYDDLKLPYPIVDVYFTGSLANYNWTSQSDIDVHLILDIPEDENVDFLAEYIDTKKDNWKNKHDITIYGFPVELYAKDSEDELENKAVYSLQDDKWISKPSKKNIKIDIDGVKIKAAEIMSDIDQAVEMSDGDSKIKMLDKIKTRIKKMRKSSLEKGGEYSTENLAFKVLRNSGYMDKLTDEKTSTIDKKLSLSEGIIKLKKENSDHKYEFGCLMLYFDIPNWNKVTDIISPSDIYNKPGYGIETGPHVTLLFGFHDDQIDVNDLKKVIKKYADRPIEVRARGISLFQSDKSPYDVVKFDIECSILHKINKELRKFPHTSSFPDYHPHMTIAYVNKGNGQKYVKEFKNPLKLTGAKIVYSKPDKTKVDWSLIKKNILKVHRDIPGMTNEKVEIIKDFINFTCAKLKMEDPVTVVLKNGRDDTISTTAAYLPEDNENHIRCGGRLVSDICKSIGHELCHNRQRELGIFKIGDRVRNIGGSIENEANAIAGILIKDFTHNYGYDKIYDF